jgi:DNA processing protein
VSELAEAAFLGVADPAAPNATRSGRRCAFVGRFDERAFLTELNARSFRWVGRSHGVFPRALGAIFDPPAGLFVRGPAPLELLDRPAVAVVGARACSPYGAHVARMLGRDLAAAGLVVISGLARGVDGAAHRGALESGGTTVAVLGCGIDRDYPATHADLARRIAESGLIVSEYPPGVAPAPWRFPARNRIIAGLTAAVVVVEARARSGALITADLALEEGREVFAVPGEITSSLSEGTNELVRLGATPLLRASDVLERFGIAAVAAPAPAVGADAALILERLREGPAGADELARGTQLEPGAVAAALGELELADAAWEADGVYRARQTGSLKN